MCEDYFVRTTVFRDHSVCGECRVRTALWGPQWVGTTVCVGTAVFVGTAACVRTTVCGDHSVWGPQRVRTTVCVGTMVCNASEDRNLIENRNVRDDRNVRTVIRGLQC